MALEAEPPVASMGSRRRTTVTGSMSVYCRWGIGKVRIHTSILNVARKLRVEERRERGFLVSLDEDFPEIEGAAKSSS